MLSSGSERNEEAEEQEVLSSKSERNEDGGREREDGREGH